MKHSAAETASVPEHESPSRWRRLRQWLGFVSSTSQREASGLVKSQSSKDIAEGSIGAGPDRDTAIAEVLNRLEAEERQGIPERFPTPLKLGPQSNGGSERLFQPPVPPGDFLKAAQLLKELRPPNP